MEEKKTSPWITPFKKQCFVVLGVSLTMGQMGLVIGFSSILLPQLKMPDSPIPIDDNSGSWIASFPAMSIVVGNLLIPFIMGKFGRKTAYYTTVVVSLVGWIGIILSTSLPVLLSVRCVQGIAMGAISTFGPLLIGEYSSPANRGAFLMTIALIIGISILSIHATGSYLNWKTSALICIAVSIMNMLFAILSPESPSWLASQGRYDECRTVFRWLRGDTDEEELEKLIDSSVVTRKSMQEDALEVSFVRKMRNCLNSLLQTLKKKEFNKPFIIMIHIYAMAQWSGVNLLASYAVDFIHTVVGRDVNVPVMIISLDAQRICSNAIGLIIIKKMKRRTMILSAVGLNILTLFVIAAYTYAKHSNVLPFDAYYNYYVGVGLIHFLTFTIAVGALPISFIIAGEIFPLQYKSMAGGVSCLFLSINLFVTIKTVPLLLSTVNVYGMYLLYCCFMIYFLVVVLSMLPETKDKTLQDIEEEFRGNKKEVIVVEKFRKNPEV